ncbi:DUF1508 domain-containing protein [Citromicrobium bathyomarinum]|uniref:YegP family protein n=1 Tax=Citromicrobium sp. WPS32 TaxID=1634517 RepID=UPI0009E8EF8E|nr:DUF1508 domain-containing protein [Citromicrobium sp. WPS32]MAY78483.1 DUF1508 domain-containing protein [Citromicrobium sp.]|tara:strand:+ start:583 stop:753 length:171 start_codon:yes stop_codon:yes gene_type:complete
MGHYKLYKDARSQWRWRYVSSNGRTIADSGESYYNKVDALNGINIMKASYNSPVYE